MSFLFHPFLPMWLLLGLWSAGLLWTSALLAWPLQATACWLSGALLALLTAQESAWSIRTQPAFVPVLALMVPVVLLLGLYFPVLNNGFTLDDPCHLVYVQEHGLWRSFWDRDLQISAMNFTPFYPLSFGLDYQLFGLNPGGYYLHHLLSFALMLGALYWALRLYLPPMGIAIALSAIVLASITVYLANTLMVRHYIEGLGWAAFALGSYVWAVRKTNWLWAVFGALLYLIAALNKELYVPLVGLLLFLPESTLRQRFAYWLPYVGAAILYVLWRWFMQGQAVVDGYSGAPLLALPLGEYAWIFSDKFPRILSWNLVHQGLVAGLSVLLILAIGRKWMRLGIIAILWIGAVIAPVIPVIPMLSARYIMMIVFSLYVALILGLYHTPWLWRQRGWVVLLGGLLLLSELAATMPQYQHNLSAQAELKAQAQFMLTNQDPQTALLTPNTHCFSAYNTLRQRQALPPTLFVNHPCALWPESSAPKRFVAYQEQRIQQQFMAPDTCQEGNERPLNVTLVIENGQVQWTFGPMQEERYQIQFSNGEVFPIMRKNQLSISNLQSILSINMITQQFRILYTERDGQITYSDRFFVDFTRNAHLSWARE